MLEKEKYIKIKKEKNMAKNNKRFVIDHASTQGVIFLESNSQGMPHLELTKDKYYLKKLPPEKKAAIKDYLSELLSKGIIKNLPVKDVNNLQVVLDAIGYSDYFGDLLYSND